MTLKSIRTHNIQVHRDVVINLPETGLIRFSGNNSNGKSVIRKVLQGIVAHSITSPAKRRSLVSFGEMFGEVTLERYDSVVLFYHIHLEAAQTYAELRIPGRDPIRRYLADKSIPILRDKFGLHSESLEGRSLNIFDSDESLLFFKTSYKLNNSVLMCAYKDPKADGTYSELAKTYKDAKMAKNNLEKSYALAEAERSSIVLYDVGKENENAHLLRRYADVLEIFPTPLRVEMLKEIPMVTFFDIQPLKILLFTYPTIFDIPSLRINTSLIQLNKDIKDIEEGVCPTCQRKFFI